MSGGRVGDGGAKGLLSTAADRGLMSEGDEYLVVPAVEGLPCPSGPRGRSTGRVGAAVKGLDFRLGREDMLKRSRVTNRVRLGL